MKFNSKLLAIALFVIVFSNPFQIQGQKSLAIDKDVVKQLFEHDHRKCGTEEATDRLARNNPDYAKEIKEFKENIVPAFSKIQSDRSAASIIYIPVVVHVIHNGESVGTGANISDGQIEAQIEILNLDFSAMNSNYNDTPAQWQGSIGNPEVQFCLAIIDPNGNPTNGITRDNIAVTGTNASNNNIDSEIKPATWWNSDDYYNIYVVGIPGTTSGGGTTGWAYYPTNGLIGTSLDGSVVDYRWFGGPGYSQSGYGTLTHETGHYLGLPHTFNGEDCGADDNIDDTPNIDAPTADYTPNLNCSPGNFPTGPISCGNEHMYVNFMDYVNDDDCTTSFTNDQINVMRAVLDGIPPPPPFNYGSRLPLTNNATTVCSFFDNDAGISGVTEPSSNSCGAGQITPIVTLQNFGESTLTTVTITYQVDGGALVDYIWIDNLPTGETQEVTLAPYTPPAGAYTFTVYTSLPNGVPDEQTTNDQQEVAVTTVTPANIPLLEGFEDVQWDPTVNGVFQFNVSGDPFEWERTTEASGFGAGTASAVFNNYDGTGGSNPGGTIDALITSVYDFSTVAGANLVFDVAYAPYDASFFDSLKVYASTDCGSTFDQLLFADGNTGLATAPATAILFTPTANQWATHTIDLSAFDNIPNLTIAFVNLSGWGNRLFIDNINISAGCNMTLDPLNTEVLCNGMCNGSASVSITGGTAPFTFQWDANAGNSTEEIVQNLCAGTYSVTVSDATFCTAETIVTITEPTVINLDIISTAETSVNANDGTATAVVSGGTGEPYDYTWDDPSSQTTSTAVNLAPGQYCVTVSDGNGCTVTGCTFVDPYDCGNFVVTATSTDIDCNGNQNGSVSAIAENGTAPYSYLWSTNDMTAEVTGLGPGDYTVTATDDNGCTSEMTVTINEPDMLSAPISATPETSANANDGTASVNPSGGTIPFTYIWNDPAGQTTETAIDLSPGEYCVTVTDENDCSVEACTTVEAFDCGNFLVTLNSTDVTCFGFADGSISSLVENGTTPYSYSWNNGEETANLDNLNPGTYTLTVTDASGCTAVETTTITEPDFMSVSVICTDETSNNANDGTCTVTVTGGTPGYIEQWSNGQSGVMISNLSPGTYCVTVTDDQGCTEEDCGTVNEVNCDFSIDILSEDVLCFGGQDGFAEVIISGGIEPFTFLWSNGAETQSINNVIANSYTVTVTDALGCEMVEQFFIQQPGELFMNFDSTNPSTNGGSDGTASAIPQGGIPGYAFAWDTGSNNQTISDLSAGVYVVTVTDLNGCTAVGEVELTDPPIDCGDFAGQTSSINISCNGENDGSIAAFVNGGTMPYEYLWSNGETSAEIGGLAAGAYSVTVTDINDCEIILTAEISEPDSLAAVIILINPSTPGGNDGSATANPSGGIPGYTYDWSNGGTTQTISGLVAGVYTLTITDANGCQKEDVIELEDPSGDCGDFVGQTGAEPVTCNGGNDGSATAFVSGGTMPYEYLWSNGETTADIDSVAAGVYTVTITDAINCELVLTSEVNEPDLLFAILQVMNSSAPGANDGSITTLTMGGTPGYTYNWSNGATTQNISGLSEGIYYLTLTDANGCSFENFAIVQDVDQNCNGLSGATFTTEVSCNGGTDGTAYVVLSSGTPPYEYSWSIGSSTSEITNIPSGTYFVTVTDANECDQIFYAFVDQPDPIEINMSGTNPSIPGGDDGTATATPSGGIPDYIYDWSNGSTTQTISGLIAGTYTVTITDANFCVMENVIILEDPVLDCNDFTLAVDVVEISCNGSENGALIAVADNGTLPYSYAWSNGVMSNANFGLGAGIYSVTVTDSIGCELSTEIELTEPPALMITMSNTAESSAGAADGTATADVSGGVMPYEYEWDNGGNTATISSLSAGMYSVTITDANGCLIVESTIVEVEGVDCSNFAIIDFQVILVSCFGGSDGAVTAISTGGTEPILYEWSNGDTGQTIQGLQAGLYVVTATDDNGCITLNEVEVTQPVSAISADFATTNETAPGAGDGAIDAMVAGGTPPYVFEWSNGANTEDLENLSTGFYTLLVTDANGCEFEVSIFIDVEEDDCAAFILSSEFENISCNGEEDGFVVATTSGGIQPITYAWNNGETTQGIFDLAPGTYVLTVTDGNDCIIVEEFIITEPLAIEINISSTDETIAGDDGTATATGSGGTGTFTYEWSNGETSPSIDNLAPGNYTVTVTDEAGCTLTEEIFIEEFTDFCGSFGGTIESTDVDCFENNNGTASAEGFGGLPPYQYSWSNGSNAPILDNLSGGTYSVTVTDENDCVIILSTVVNEPAELSLQLEAFNGNCGATGTISALVNGGTSGYEYSWSTGGTDDFISNLEDGVYTLTVSDANACTITGEAVIENDEGGIEIETEVNQVTCYGDSDGEIDITTLAGTAPFNYSWNTGETSEDLQNLEAGTYTVLITDANNCSFLTTFEVSSPAELVANIDWTPATNGNNGTATATAYGGNTPYTYQWSTGANNASIENLNSGNYAVTITDANGCEATSTVFIGTTAVDELPGLETLIISPNPSNGNFVLNAAFSTYKEGMVEIYNILGQQIFANNFTGRDFRLDIGLIDASAGSYFLVIKTEEGRAVRKLIIQK